MKLTAELILQSAQFTNALKDRELDLRGIHFRVLYFWAEQYSLTVEKVGFVIVGIRCKVPSPIHVWCSQWPRGCPRNFPSPSNLECKSTWPTYQLGPILIYGNSDSMHDSEQFYMYIWFIGYKIPVIENLGATLVSLPIQLTETAWGLTSIGIDIQITYSLFSQFRLMYR
jgi:hypothetical protein